MKRTVPLIIAATVGFVVIISWFIPYAQSWGQNVMIWFDILAAIAIVLGGGNLVKMHLRKVSDRRSGWGYSLITLLAFFTTLAIGLSKFGVNPSELYPDYVWSGNHLQEGGGFWWIYQYLYLPLASTMFALLAFFIASAAFRAFRAKNVEAIILLGTAFFVLFGKTYAGVIVSKAPLEWISTTLGWQTDALEMFRLDRFQETIMDTFNAWGNRAIMIGIALGVASLSLKVLLGVDRSYLGSQE